MKGVSLSLKITSVFVLVSTFTLGFLYYGFHHLIDDYLLKVEAEKATLIAMTIEPAIAMNQYLGMQDEVKRIAEQTVTNPELLGLSVTLGEQLVWSNKYDKNKKHINIVYPVKDPVTGLENGKINLSFSLANYETAIASVKQKIFYYLGILAVLFIVFSLVIRYILQPLRDIAKEISKVSLDSSVDFSAVRVEKETSEITHAFERMMKNVHEQTVLLERYKHSMDESSIVSKINLAGDITYVNDEFCRVSGFAREELVGSKMCDACKPDYNEGSCDTVWSRINSKSIWKGPVKNKRKDGSIFYVRATIVPIIDDKGEIIEFISIQNDITRLIEQKEQIMRQTTDIVTGMQNRIKMQEDLKITVKPKMALINIDNYSIIRDYYGFAIGSRSIMEVGEILKDFVKDKDVEVYKMASGEFALLAGSDTEIEFFELICKHLVNKIDALTISIDDSMFNPRAYCGISSNQEKILSFASLAMRHAQENDKPVIVYENTENLVQQYEDNIIWTRKIREALIDNRIVVYVQPIINARTDLVEKYECLVRMIDENGKVISPFFFLDIAKKSKLYGQITHRVVSVAIEALSNAPDMSFTINLSVEDLVDPETTDFIKRQITQHDVGDRLVFEIVESEGFDSYNEAKQFISDVQKLGCKIAIDDFGTGYSNFAYLLELNVDIIKIDGSLIKTIDHDKNSQIITSTILDFSRQLNLTTVAEFVHNEAVLNYVKSIGVDYLQGFHLGEPVPIESLKRDLLISSQSA